MTEIALALWVLMAVVVIGFVVGIVALLFFAGRALVRFSNRKDEDQP